MRLEGLQATADIVGRRLRVSWTWTLAALETAGDVPHVQLRRKERDFEFPPSPPPDPFVVYDSAMFPPPPIPNVRTVIDLPAWEEVDDGLRVHGTAISVAAVVSGRPVEQLRRTISTIYSPLGVPWRIRVELVDALQLAPRTAYYYQLFDGMTPAADERPRYRAIATPGDTHGLNRRLYEMLPEVYKRHDVRALPPEHEHPGVPESAPLGGQLRRFIDMFGMGFDAMRSSAEQLLDLHDLHRVDARRLPALSRMIGWDPTEEAPIPLQRNELLAATRLFDVMGTVPAMRALVTYQTGWHAQVTEFAQHIARANEPARRNVFVAEERPGAPVRWEGADDASDVMSFPTAGATGAGALPAVLTSVAVEPFALRAGMELTITVDDGVPARVRFGADDFVDIGAATALEIVRVIAVAFDTLTARDVGGSVELRTHAVGPTAALRVDAAVTTLLSFSDACGGPLTVVTDAAGRLRLFYEEQRDARWSEQPLPPPTAVHRRPLATVARRESPVAERLRRTICYKGWGHGRWHEERRLPAFVGDAVSPSVAVLPDDRHLLVWREAGAPTSRGRLHACVGTPRTATAAIITGQRPEPFALVPGTQLRLQGQFGDEMFTVIPADYVNPLQATAAEVALAMAAQLVQVSASIAAGGVIRLATTATGDDAFLQVDLTQSTAARALGLASAGVRGRGQWDDEMDWSGVWTVQTSGAPVADPTVLADPLGGARLVWSEHRASRWEVRQAHVSERVTVATAAGVGQRSDSSGAWQIWRMADGLPSDDVRDLVLDANGTVWMATSAGLASRQPDNAFVTYTTLDGLGSDDIRALALLPHGRLCCATPVGLSFREADGTFTVVTATPGGLTNDDVRTVSAAPDGTLWVGTTAGVDRLTADGAWSGYGAANGLPTVATAHVAVSERGTVAVATAGGVAISDVPPEYLPTGRTWHPQFVTHAVPDGLPSNDIRALAWHDDNLHVATAAGIAIRTGRVWRVLGTAHGLPTSDIRSIELLPTGGWLVGTAAGLVSGREGMWRVERAVDGLPADVLSAARGGLSSPVTLASGAGGHREPRAIVDGVGRSWLVWSRREDPVAALQDTWTIRLRRFDPTVAPWGWEPERAVTVSPAGGTSDREPTLERAGGGMRVFFSSDRHGGRGVWSIGLDAAGNPLAAPASLPDSASEQTSPVAIAGPTGRSWLFYRSDRSLVPAQAGMLAPTHTGAHRSQRVPDAGALRVQSGCRTPVLAHASRNLGRRRWGDLFTYTPQYPQLVSEDAPADDHLYTRRTVALHLRQARTGQAVTEEQVRRLLQLLRRSVPINLRLVLIVSPEALVEFIYTADADLMDSYTDDVPLAEVMGEIIDSSMVQSNLLVLLSNELTSLSASIADPTTLRRRTWFPDLL